MAKNNYNNDNNNNNFNKSNNVYNENEINNKSNYKHFYLRILKFKSRDIEISMHPSLSALSYRTFAA